MRVLCMEHEGAARDLLGAVFTRQGLRCDHASKAEEGLERGLCAEYDLIVLDDRLPDMQGVEAVQAFRHCSVLSPIMVLAENVDHQHVVRLLDAGADSYVPLPIHAREFEARTRALLRLKPEMIGDLIIDFENHLVYFDRHLIHLTNREYDVLEVLAHNPNRLVPGSRMTSALYGCEEPPEANCICVFVARLRKKLKIAGSQARVESRRELGYMLKFD